MKEFSNVLKHNIYTCKINRFPISEATEEMKKIAFIKFFCF